MLTRRLPTRPPWLNGATAFCVLAQLTYWLAIAYGCAPVNDQAV